MWSGRGLVWTIPNVELHLWSFGSRDPAQKEVEVELENYNKI